MFGTEPLGKPFEPKMPTGSPIKWEYKRAPQFILQYPKGVTRRGDIVRPNEEIAKEILDRLNSGASVGIPQDLTIRIAKNGEVLPIGYLWSLTIIDADGHVHHVPSRPTEEKAPEETQPEPTKRRGREFL
jgi:hypothetical protein